MRYAATLQGSPIEISEGILLFNNVENLIEIPSACSVQYTPNKTFQADISVNKNLLSFYACFLQG